MLTPVLKSCDSYDHDPIQLWVPDGDEVYYWLNCVIGLEGSDAADLYRVPVLNVRGLKSDRWRGHRRRGRASDPPAIVVEPYSWEGVLAELRRRLDSCSGHDWFHINDALRKLFDWEYEGM